MPSSYPFPSVESLALSMLVTVKKVDKLARVIEYEPHEFVLIVRQVNIYNRDSEGL